MVEETLEEQEIIEQPKKTTDSVYDKLSSFTPEQEIDTFEDEGELTEHKTLTAVMAESPNLTDVQSALRQLFPKSENSWLDNVQMSRVFPDVYNPLARIFVKDLIQNSNGDLSVAEAIAGVNTSMSIGIDGEGRIDVIAIMGKAADNEIEKEKNKLNFT